MAHGFAPLVDMAQAPEKPPEVAAATPEATSQPRYPYGLCIALCEDDLAKLKIADLPQVGAMIHLAAMAKVTSVSSSERQGGDGAPEQSRRVELQITHIAVENEDEEDLIEQEAERTKARRARMYDTVDLDRG